MLPQQRQSLSLEDRLKRLLVRLLAFLFKPSHIPEYHKESITNILVVRQHDQLGDMLCVVPLLKTLRLQFPNAFITLVTSPVNYEIMKYHPYINHVLNYDKAKLRSSLEEIQRFIRSLRQREYDLAIVPVTVSISVTSDLLALLSGANIRLGAGMLYGKENPTSFCFTHCAELDWSNDPHRHQALRNIDILQPLGLPAEPLTFKIGIREEEQLEAKEFLLPFREKHPTILGIHPGAGKIENRWDAENFAEIANRAFTDCGTFTVITAGTMDDEPIEKIIKHLTCPYVIIRNKPLRFVAAVINELDYFLSNDTGIMHVAGATKTPLLALFGPTDPLQWMPFNEASKDSMRQYIAARDGKITTIAVDEVYSTLYKMIRPSN